MNLRHLFLQAKEYLFRPYRAFRMSRFVWTHILNRDAKHRFQRNSVVLTPIQERIVNDLRQNGVAFSSLEELFPNSNLLETLQSHALSLESNAQQRTTKKPFILEYWDAFPSLTLENPFIRISLDSKILAIVNTYLGIWAKFYYFMLGRTRVASSELQTPTASQRWHRDFEEWRMCKMFIYLSDVDVDSGPFTYIVGSHTDELRKRFPQRFGRDSYPPDGSIEALVPKERMLECVGTAGTVIFADTTGLHKGGYAKKNERLMFTAGYKSLAGYGNKRYSISKEEHAKVKAISAEAEYAIYAHSS